MFHEEIISAGLDHITSFPVFEKKLVYQENGDVIEEFVELAPDSMLRHMSSSLFSDALNGTQVADCSHFDKFQLMDALEFAIDNMSEDTIEKLKGKINE